MHERSRIQSVFIKMKFQIIYSIPLLISAISLNSCATIYTDTKQTMNILTTCRSQSRVIPSECEVNTRKGIFKIFTPSAVQIPRNIERIGISCTVGGIKNPEVTIKSTENWKWAGNVNPLTPSFGVIGVVVDVASGSAYQLPSFVRLELKCS